MYSTFHCEHKNKLYICEKPLSTCFNALWSWHKCSVITTVFQSSYIWSFKVKLQSGWRRGRSWPFAVGAVDLLKCNMSQLFWQNVKVIRKFRNDDNLYVVSFFFFCTFIVFGLNVNFCGKIYSCVSMCGMCIYDFRPIIFSVWGL